MIIDEFRFQMQLSAGSWISFCQNLFLCIHLLGCFLQSFIIAVRCCFSTVIRLLLHVIKMNGIYGLLIAHQYYMV